DARPLREDEAAHLRVPASRLVAEVDPGLQEVAHGGDCHGAPSSGGFGTAPAGSGHTGRKSRHPHRDCSAGSWDWVAESLAAPTKRLAVRRPRGPAAAATRRPPARR